MKRTAEQCLSDICDFSTPPPGVPTARWRRKVSQGSVELGFYRGKHEGIYEAYLAIKDSYPKAARRILRWFNMREDGSIGVG